MKPAFRVVVVFGLVVLVIAWWLDREVVVGSATGMKDVTSQVKATGVEGRLADRWNSGVSQGLGGAGMMPSAYDKWHEELPETMPEVFGAFREWANRYLSTRIEARPALEAEGMKLAKERQRAMADLMQSQPGKVLSLVAPAEIRRVMPEELKTYMEEIVNRRADLQVGAGLATTGKADDLGDPVVRWIEVNGERYQAFAEGGAAQWVTKRDVAVNGVAVPASAATNPRTTPLLKPDKLMALSETPARVLDPVEVKEALVAAMADGAALKCATAQEPVKVESNPVAIQIGGEKPVFFCGPNCGQMMAAAALAGGNYTQPDGVTAMAAPIQPGTNGYTQGTKKMLFIRVDFPDLVENGSGNVTITQAGAETLLRDLAERSRLMSYDTLKIAPLSAKEAGGSCVTTVLRASRTAASYDNDVLGTLLPEMRTVANAAGYLRDKYDFVAIFTHGRPAASYAGLAWVGGVGFHMANGYFGLDVTAHEFGHNLGLPHSHFWDTSDKSTIGTGNHVEYGNPYDSMGATYDGIPGVKHYVGSYKRYLNWIPDADQTIVSSSGKYRLVATDDKVSRGTRLLRLNVSGARDYYVEYRANLTEAQFQNGVFVNWGNDDGRSGYLLDHQPNSSSGRALVMGRTFTDPAASVSGGTGVHITPIGKGGTYPESMDVFVALGTAAANKPPVVTLTSSSLGGGAAAPILFTVQATDPNGDALAYFWDFGDGSYSVDNLPTQSHGYDSDGEYVVQVSVSDMKGGVTRDSVIVKIGSPSPLYRISGRVFDPNGNPLSGIQIKAVNGSTTRSGWTDSDGSYVLTRLDAGSWTVSARELVADSLNFVLPFTTGAIALSTGTPQVSGVDFIGSSGPQETLTTLVAKKSTWKYFASNVAPSGTWQGTSYSDTAWTSGSGVFGYGNDSQDTVLSYGSDDANKWNAAYFRKTFTVSSLSGLTALRLQTLRDDGVVVYLNGTEVYRDNLPEGSVTYTTKANDATEPGEYLTKELPLTGLVVGTNVIAAEVHQVTGTSSDLAFDATLLGVSPSEGASAPMVYFNSPVDRQIFYTPLTTIPLNVSARVKAPATVSLVEYWLNGVKQGESTTAPYTFTLTAPSVGTHTLQAKATIGTTVEVSPMVSIIVAAPQTAVTPRGSSWRWFDAAQAPASGWTTLSYAEPATWKNGTAVLGFGETGLGTTLASGRSAYYFRKEILIEDPAALSNLTAKLIRDDGAVIYLNGTEIARSNMEVGAVAYETLAKNAGAADLEAAIYSYPVPNTLLRPGKNVLAAEVHQQATTSSDLRFDLWLEANARTPRARGVTATAPTSARVGFAAELKAEAWPGAGLDVRQIEFLINGELVGADTTWPFSLIWTPSTSGGNTFIARATDSAGETFESAPTNIPVAIAPLSTAFVSWGDTWKYWEKAEEPAATWKTTAFDDSAWFSGAGRLGYGGDGEMTVLNYGSVSSAKNITAWFRKTFTASGSYTGLRLQVVRDDGVIVYLNGTEIFRDHMPAGPVTATTLANADTGGVDETTPLEIIIPASALVSGTNVLSAEVHQRSANSSDLGFDAQLTGFSTPAGQFLLTSPSTGSKSMIDDPLTLSVTVSASLEEPEEVEFFAGQASIGRRTSAPWRFTWTTPLLGTYAITARGKWADGSLRTTNASTVVITKAVGTLPIIAGGEAWKYSDGLTTPADQGNAPALTWKDSAYNDAPPTAWKSGNARLGFGLDGEETVLIPGTTTYYFRKAVTLTSTHLAAQQFSFRVQRDDGIVVYVNGREVWRDNMPSGTPTHATLAGSTTGDEQAWRSFNVPATSFIVGTNVIAAEVHQNSATSSDVSFDLEMSAATENLAAISNTAPAAAPPISIELDSSNTSDVAVTVRDAKNGRLYVIECTEDFHSWTPLRYEVVSSGSFPTLPVVTSSVPARYYRARWLAALP